MVGYVVNRVTVWVRIDPAAFKKSREQRVSVTRVPDAIGHVIGCRRNEPRDGVAAAPVPEHLK
jgi:hypothetical protein